MEEHWRTQAYCEDHGIQVIVNWSEVTPMRQLRGEFVMDDPNAVQVYVSMACCGLGKNIVMSKENLAALVRR